MAELTYVPFENITANTELVAAVASTDHRVAGLLILDNDAVATINLKHGSTSFFGDYDIYPGNGLFLPLLDVFDDAEAFRENRYYYKTDQNEALNLDVSVTSGDVTGGVWHFSVS